MDKVLRPERLETDPNRGEASKEWLHWKRTFDNFLAVLPQRPQQALGIGELRFSLNLSTHRGVHRL